MIEIRHLYVSAGHNYFGRHGLEPLAHPMEERTRIRCVAGRGIEGDRFFDFKDDYKGQITFFAGEVYDELCHQLDCHDRAPWVFRRNVITSGVDWNTLIGREFSLQGVRFLGTAECSPCYWMDQAFHAGAEKALRGRGGLRARILSDGWLMVGSADLPQAETHAPAA